MPFSIIRADITKVKADAIVNTANPEVAVGDGVDAAIYKAAGKEKLLEERRKIGRLEPGEVGITPAFGLHAKFIIHSSGPYWEGGDCGEETLLRQCYDRALLLACENDCKSIAFPLLATGTYEFPQELGIRIAIDAFTAFLEEHEMEITLVVFEEYAYHVSGRIFDDVKSFVDDEYVHAALENECVDTAFEDDYEEIDALPADMVMIQTGAAFSEEKASMSLEDELKEMYTDSFEKHLQQLINKKGLKNSEIYAAANISKQYFSKLLKGQVKPSKEKVMALAVGLRLNLDETVDFLRLAGYALSPISQTDVVVQYFIVRKIYSVMKIDMALFDYGLDPLSKG